MNDGAWPDDDRDPDSGDGQRDTSSGVPDLPAEWAGIVIPDDARELSTEAAEVRREIQRRRRADRLTRVLRTRRWRRYGISGPLVVLCVLITSIFASLIFLLPSTPSGPQVQRLARPRAADGAVGGLLPAATLETSTGGTVETRSVRPAVVLVLPSGCACSAIVDEIVTDTTTARVDVLVLAEGTKTPRSLPASAPRERVTSAADPARVVGLAVLANGRPAGGALTPTGVFVRGDGTVASALSDVQSRQNLTAEIDNIL